ARRSPTLARRSTSRSPGARRSDWRRGPGTAGRTRRASRRTPGARCRRTPSPGPPPAADRTPAPEPLARPRPRRRAGATARGTAARRAAPWPSPALSGERGELAQAVAAQLLADDLHRLEQGRRRLPARHADAQKGEDVLGLPATLLTEAAGRRLEVTGGEP